MGDMMVYDGPGRGENRGRPLTQAEFLKRYPHCVRCMRERGGQLGHSSSHVIRNLKGQPEPVCEGHYASFCVGFGNMLIMQYMLGAGRRWKNV